MSYATSGLGRGLDLAFLVPKKISTLYLFYTSYFGFSQLSDVIHICFYLDPQNLSGSHLKQTVEDWGYGFRAFLKTGR